MRKETTRKVTDALRQHGPTTAQNIAKITRLSYNTVRNALAAIGAESDGAYPAEWKFNEAVADNVVSIATKKPINDNSLSIELKSIPLNKWNEQHARLGKTLIDLEITPTSNPTKLSKMLLTGAATLASLGTALEGAKDSPDWYTILGGELEPETPTK